MIVSPVSAVVAFILKCCLANCTFDIFNGILMSGFMPIQIGEVFFYEYPTITTQKYFHCSVKKIKRNANKFKLFGIQQLCVCLQLQTSNNDIVVI